MHLGKSECLFIDYIIIYFHCFLKGSMDCLKESTCPRMVIDLLPTLVVWNILFLVILH